MKIIRLYVAKFNELCAIILPNPINLNYQCIYLVMHWTPIDTIFYCWCVEIIIVHLFIIWFDKMSNDNINNNRIERIHTNHSKWEYCLIFFWNFLFYWYIISNWIYIPIKWTDFDDQDSNFKLVICIFKLCTLDWI